MQDFLLEAAWEISVFLQGGVWPAAVPAVTRLRAFPGEVTTDPPVPCSCPLLCPACHHCPHTLGGVLQEARNSRDFLLVHPCCLSARSAPSSLGRCPWPGPLPSAGPTAGLGTAGASPRARRLSHPRSRMAAVPSAGGLLITSASLLTAHAFLAACAAQIPWPEFPQAGWRGAARHGAQRPRPRSAAAASAHRLGLSSPGLAREKQPWCCWPEGLGIPKRSTLCLLRG